jgi:hypothetical protein
VIFVNARALSVLIYGALIRQKGIFKMAMLPLRAVRLFRFREDEGSMFCVREQKSSRRMLFHKHTPLHKHFYAASTILQHCAALLF